MTAPKIAHDYVAGLREAAEVFREWLPRATRFLAMPHFGWLVVLVLVTSFISFLQNQTLKQVENYETLGEYTGCHYTRPTGTKDTTGKAVCENGGQPWTKSLDDGALFKVYDRPNAPVRCYQVRGAESERTYAVCWLGSDGDTQERL